MKQKLLKWGICLLAGVLVCTAVLLLPNGGSVLYGMTEGAISFSKAEFDITELVRSGEEYLARQNSYYEMLLDKSANLIVRDKASGYSWYAVAPDSEFADEKHTSSFNLGYYEKNAQTMLYSSADCVEKNQVRVYSTDTGVRVEYIFGEMSEDFVFPEQISERRMKQLMAEMTEEDAAYIDRRYTLYSIELAEGANREYLLSQYPRLEKENLYVLTDASNSNMKKKIDEIFRSVGYTAEDRDRDNSGAESVKENPKSFKVAVDYALTETGFSARIDGKELLFYHDYPISEIEFLPNFSCFAAGETGYYVIPSGSGALMSVDSNKAYADEAYSLPVYGQNSTVTRRQDMQEAVCTLPVFGQYKNGKGFLCVLSQGAEQAQLQFRRSSPYTKGFAAFTVVDNGIYQMKSKTDTTLFSADVSAKQISVEYLLLRDVSEQDAYSQMASLYRDRLKAEGILSKTADSSSPKLLAEMVGSIAYDTHFCGLIPTKKEAALTNYAQIADISSELQKTIGKGNLEVLISGWNKNGLNAQQPGTVRYSSTLGGQGGFRRMLDSLKEQGIPYYVNLEFALVNPQGLFGYSSTSKSARSLNNSIVRLSYLDAVTCAWKESDVQLVSPLQYQGLAETYLKKTENISGIGVSQLTGMLYGDYANRKNNTRGQSQEQITEALTKLSEHHAVIGNAGNLYALEYLSFVDDLTDSQALYTFSRQIPFVQMVLHGYLPYTAASMNREEDQSTALLKLIESGGNLRYTLTANEFDTLYSTDFSHLDHTNYGNLKEEIKTNYATLKDALDGLMDQEIVSHHILTDDVVCVRFADGTQIYVNYGESDYQEAGILVPAHDYLRDK